MIHTTPKHDQAVLVAAIHNVQVQGHASFDNHDPVLFYVDPDPMRMGTVMLTASTDADGKWFTDCYGGAAFSGTVDPTNLVVVRAASRILAACADFVDRMNLMQGGQ